ncbi:hypothetical protein LR48_Vigan05g032800 [Vigna angularis]|uniref:Uncharacterized protein n=1 Tax=Phaseolus angularis TaxID=3914 RepID=A0A0L9UJI2_PHAAN|nr:hypothetical protein LR48_Vigan05g032800 [Vigna angularis]
MSGQDPSRPDKGKTLKNPRRQAKYIIRVPSTMPFASASTPPDQKVQWAAEHEAQIKKRIEFHLQLPRVFTPQYYRGLLPIVELGRAVHVDEVFTQTHLRKGTGEYVDERSRKTIEDFSARLTQARSKGESAPNANSRVDVDEEIIRTQCWVNVIGGKKKGRLYGVGQLVSHYSAGRGGILRHQPSTSGTFDHNNVDIDTSEGQSAPSSSQQPCPPQQPSQTTPVQEEDHDDFDDYDEY